ncbi:alanyl-tRNA editing protein [Parafrigoribacterium humi]|jgi:alanyl-tRNA synthetase|uniref:metal-dependent hydrolase n=1 Tax=Parafrigoribacterium humi TaxID=3144664 RepID=UPI0032EF1F7F
MTLPSSDTVVSYPSGSTTGTSTVVHVEPLDDGRTAVLLESTPCHPVDAGWPDQGADRARLEWGAGSASVVDCLVGASDGAQLFLGVDIPVRKGTEGWAFLVAHIIDAVPPATGESVTVTVDAEYRRSMSLGHTGCHLASLALNHALADRWGKEAALDALGVPDFDKLAIDSSTILPFGSVDTFRLNKSLRRKGFVSDGLADALPEVERALNASLDGWLATGAAVAIRREGDRLTDRRYWECTLPEGGVSIPCGGTHAESLAALGALRATLALSDDAGTAVLTMTTGRETS